MKRYPPAQQQAPGRVELVRPPTRLRNFGIGCCVFIAFLAGGAGYLVIFQHFTLTQLFILGVVIFIMVAIFMPIAIYRFIQELTDALNDPDRRHYKEAKIKAKEEQRREQQAASALANAPDSVGEPAAAVLGAATVGTLPWSIGPYAILPPGELAKHGVVIGGSGSGKTESLLRLAYIAAVVYGYRVFFIDAKGDPGTAARFLAVMRQAGVTSAMFPRQPFNGFQGDASAILNRLTSILDFSEPFYEDVVRDVLTSVCFDRSGPPQSSRDLLQRLNTRLAASPGNRNLEGVVLRYRSFFGMLAGSLDNGFSWEDSRAAYVLLDSLSLKKQAEGLGRYMIEDFVHYATRRKRPGLDLLIVDEYPAISTGSDAANLIERIRRYNCAVVLSAQSYAELGGERDAEKILDAANFLMIHRTAAPERLTARAGMAQVERESYQIGGFTHGAVMATVEDKDAIHPDEARRLQTAEAIVIAHGHYLKARIAQTPEPDPALVDKARAWIDQPSTPASSYHHQAQPSQPLVRQIHGPTITQHQAQAPASLPTQPSAPMLRLPQHRTTSQQPAAWPGQTPPGPPELL